MAMPPGVPPGDLRERRGIFGQAAFRSGWVLASLTLLLGALMVVVGDGAVASAGAAMLALGGLAVLTAALGMLAERAVARRNPPPPPEPPPHLNGHRRR